ncbi:MAG: type II secretion system F family protein [Acidimicrobiales bacterium]
MSATLHSPPTAPDLTPTSQPQRRKTKTPWYKREYSLGSPVKAEDLMNFSRQAASFLQAGIPVLDALAIVAEETSSKKLAEVLQDIRQRVRAGSSFGDAVAAHPTVFPGHYIAMVRASELTGNLDIVFEQLSSYLERDLEAKRQVKSALTYPAIVMVLAVVAVIIMATFILPKFKGLYKTLGGKLPLPTRMLLGITDFFTGYWMFIAGGLVAAFVVGLVVLGGDMGKGRRDKLILKLPVIGSLMDYVIVERFCRVMAALVTAGVPLPDALAVSSEATNNRVYQGKLAGAREAMIRGEGLARPITAAGLFPAAARQMIRVGESTGTLDQQLHNAAKFYERELSYRLKRATDMLEPAVVVGVGLTVGFVAVAQVSAMYSIFKQVKPA